MNLHPDEAAFYFSALAQIPPERQPDFIHHVVATLGAQPVCELGPGDVARAVRAAFAMTWTPIPDEIHKRPRPRAVPKDVPPFEPQRRPRVKPG